jgi:glycosyltransferase involved in cell wall biosynthesis
MAILPVDFIIPATLRGNRVPVRFSIFIPVYNDARWLAGAIDSVLAQSYQDWELVIGDNASERDLAAIVAAYPDPRIRYHRWETHTDFVDNHNRTLGLCQFEWLLLLSADDRLHPECLAKMAARLERHLADGTKPAMIATACRPVDEAGMPATFEFSGSWRIKQLSDGLYDGRAWLHHVAAPGQVPWNVGSLAVGRHVTEILGGFYRVEIGLSVDIDMALRVGAYGPVAYISEPLLDYTVRPGGMNKELARKDRARARMTSHGSVLRSGLAVHEARREVGDDERRYVRKMIGQSFIGRALQHRYLPDGSGRRGAIGNVARAFRHDPLWFTSPRQALRGLAAIFAPTWTISRAKDRLKSRGATF